MERKRTDRSGTTLPGFPPYPLLAAAESRRQSPRFELRCTSCGHGAVSDEPIRCPVCGDEAWDFAEWRPFQR